MARRALIAAGTALAAAGVLASLTGGAAAAPAARAAGPAPAAKAAAGAPKITVTRIGQTASYTVRVAPASKLVATLITFGLCDATGQYCSDPDEIDTIVLPAKAVHRISSLAAFWEQPAGTRGGGLYPGTYRIALTTPGQKSTVGIQFTVKPDA